MALNPFHGFRKHQKTLLAGLTIFTMIVFILNFGPGDIFSSFGRNRGREIKPVATLYSQPIYAEQVYDIRNQREMANAFILELIDRSHATIIERTELELMPILKGDRDERASRSVKQIVDAWKQAFRPDPTQRQNPFALFAYYQILQPMDRRLPSPVDMLRFYEGQLSSKESQEKKESIQRLLTMLEQDKKLLMMRGVAGASYFGGGSTANLRDLLDFKIWLHEADRLGINLTEDSLIEMTNQDALNQFGRKSDVYDKIYGQMMRRYKNLSQDGLKNALTNEYRVRLARVTVLGYDAAGANVPPAVTPYDVYQFFRENRTENSLVLLPVSADRKEFLSRIPDPPESELKAFYDKYKKREDDPGAREPGFKAPPKRAIEWVAARADSPFYKAEAKKQYERNRQVSDAAIMLSSGTFSDPVGAAVNLALPQSFDVGLWAKYEREVKYTSEMGRQIYRLASWLDPDNTALHDVSLNRPEGVAALVGQAVGVGGTQGAILSAPGALVGAAYSHDAKYRSRVWTDLFLASSQPNPLTAFGMVQSQRQMDGEYMPFHKLRDVVEEKFLTDYARRLAHDNLKQVEAELDRLNQESGDSLQQQDWGSNPQILTSTLGKLAGLGGTGASPFDAATLYLNRYREQETKTRAREVATLVLGATVPLLDQGLLHGKEKLPQLRAQEYLAEAIKKYGLEHGTTSKMRDRYDIADDPGLATLKQSYDKPWNHSTTSKPKKFANMFFPGRDERLQITPYKAQPMPAGNVRAGFDEWAISTSPMLYWMTSESPAYVPQFDEVKSRVLERWKLTKAREMARKDANAVASEINSKNLNAEDATRVVKDYAAKFGINLINLDRVSRLSPPALPAVIARDPNSGYQRYKIPEDRVEFPAGRFIDDMTKMTKPGEARVLIDRPESTYYVAVLQTRSVPDFYTEFTRNEKAFLDRMEQDAHPRLKFQEGLVAQLEKAAGLKIEDEAFEKEFNNSGSRRNRGGGGDDE